MKEFLDRNVFKILLLLILVVHFIGLFCDIFNGDSALYASIAKNMACSGDWLILNSVMQENWIDKPHLAFWIWAIFIKIFGNTNFGFKLPSFLALLVLLRYLFLFTKKYYNEKTAWYTVLILSSSLHILISTNDVRIDIFLICFMMAAIYHFQSYLYQQHLSQIFLGTTFTSLAVMTKGIYVLIPISASILVSSIHYRHTIKIIIWHWFLSLVVFIVGIAPALYALKIQFSHFKDCLILGQKASNYLQFFFWDSQFGRFQSNLGQVQSNGDPSFYLHTLLWAFAPWTAFIFLVPILKRNPLKEYISVSCFLILLIVISISKTQLSHHCLILLPFLSILSAIIFCDTLWRLQNKFFLSLIFSLFIAIVIVSFYFTKVVFGLYYLDKMIIPFTVAVMLVIWSYLFIVDRILILFTAFSVYLGIYLHLIFYPEILKYQSGITVHHYMSRMDKRESIEEFYVNISLLNFYSSHTVKNTKVSNMAELLNKKNQLIITNDYGINYFELQKVKIVKLETFLDYRTTVLKDDFLNRTTRENACEKHYLIRINPN